MSSEVRIIYNEDRTSLTSASNSIDVLIPKTVKLIEGTSTINYAFLLSVSTLKTVSFEEGSSLQKISNYAFYNCKKLNKIELEKCKNLVSIGSYAFYQCTSLQTVSFPSDKFTTFDSYCFMYSGLTSVYIPASVTTINQHSFSYCNSLASFVFDPNVKITTISPCLRSIKIAELTIPKSVTSFYGSCLEDCTNLQNVYVEAGNTVYSSNDGVLY